MKRYQSTILFIVVLLFFQVSVQTDGAYSQETEVPKKALPLSLDQILDHIEKTVKRQDLVTKQNQKMLLTTPRALS